MPENHRTIRLSQHGFEIHRRVFATDEIERLRTEADRVAAEAGTACVRNLGSRSAIFRELANSPKLRDIFHNEALLAVRFLLFDKTPEENWPVAWHQDLTIATKAEISCEGYGPWSVKDGIPHTHAPTGLLQQMVTARIHLDPTDEENGALMVAPATHLLGKISAAAIPELTRESAFTCLPTG